MPNKERDAQRRTGMNRTAIEFASLLKLRCEGEHATGLRHHARGQGEHKYLGDFARPVLDRFVAEGVERFLDWEGAKRTGAQRHSYPLLGTDTHPDAAVLAPFRLAIECDRESSRTKSISHFKTCLMKTACHVLSGAYDAALLVFTLSRPTSTANTYLKDHKPGYAFTDQLLTNLRAQGVVIAFVPAG